MNDLEEKLEKVEKRLHRFEIETYNLGMHLLRIRGNGKRVLNIGDDGPLDLTNQILSALVSTSMPDGVPEYWMQNKIKAVIEKWLDDRDVLL